MLTLLVMDTQDYDAMNFGSIAGIILITGFVVELLKVLIKPTTPYLNKIPVILLPLIIAPALALVANKLMKLDNGAPYLSGNLWVVIGRSIMGAATSSGLYSWLRDARRGVGDATPITGPQGPQEPG